MVKDIKILPHLVFNVQLAKVNSQFFDRLPITSALVLQTNNMSSWFSFSFEL